MRACPPKEIDGELGSLPLIGNILLAYRNPTATGEHFWGKLCQTPLVHPEEMQAAFVQAINRVVGSKAKIIDLCEKALNRQEELDGLLPPLSTWLDPQLWTLHKTWDRPEIRAELFISDPRYIYCCSLSPRVTTDPFPEGNRTYGRRWYLFIGIKVLFIHFADHGEPRRYLDCEKA